MKYWKNTGCDTYRTLDGELSEALDETVGEAVLESLKRKLSRHEMKVK